MTLPKKSEIRKEAKRLLYIEGKSKQEAFTLLNQKYHNTERVTDVLQYLPSQTLRNKYKSHEFWLIGFIIAVISSFLWDSASYSGIINLLALLYIVVMKRIEYYIYLTVLMSIMVLALIISPMISGSFDWIVIFKYIIPCAGIVFLSYWLEKKLCPIPLVIKEKYLDQDGHEQFRIKVQFED